MSINHISYLKQIRTLEIQNWLYKPYSTVLVHSFKVLVVSVVMMFNLAHHIMIPSNTKRPKHDNQDRLITACTLQILSLVPDLFKRKQMSPQEIMQSVETDLQTKI
ncbi:hypothetical protein P8452_33202 [Trifolium repens]|nr:hypothetical protein P8452_33202 [Trifolium repens]